MNETFWGLSPTAWIALLTVAITLIAVVQVCVYVLQAGYMREGLKETRKAVNTADQTMRIAHRACLNVIAIKFISFEAEHSVSLTLTVTNSGHLPANLQATSVALWTGIDDPFPEVESNGIPLHENWGVQHGLIPPGGLESQNSQRDGEFPSTSDLSQIRMGIAPARQVPR